MIFTLGRRKERRSLSQRLEEVAQFAHQIVGDRGVEDLEQQTEGVGAIDPNEEPAESQDLVTSEQLPPVLSEASPLLVANSQSLVIYTPFRQTPLLQKVKDWLARYFAVPRTPVGWWMSLFTFFVVVATIVVISQFQSSHKWLLLVGCQLERLIFGSDPFGLCSRRE